MKLEFYCEQRTREPNAASVQIELTELVKLDEEFRYVLLRLKKRFYTILAHIHSVK